MQPYVIDRGFTHKANGSSDPAERVYLEKSLVGKYAERLESL